MDYMSSVQRIREQIRHLYQSNPHIHIDISLTSPKINFSNDAVTITGVYPHIFQIEEYTSGKPKQHTLQYTEVIIGKIIIKELEKGKE